MVSRIIEDITNFVFIQDEPQKSDIIFIPGGSHPQAGESAAALYAQGYAEKIMPSGHASITLGSFAGVKERADIYCKKYETECDFLVDVLQINGVPEQAILRENAARYTKENADFSRRVADKEGLTIQTAIICCKNFHARRCLMYYQLAFPHTTFYICPAPYTENGIAIDAENWYTTETGVKRIMGEMQRYGTQFQNEFLALLPQK